jgi:hypothetical protein
MVEDKVKQESKLAVHVMLFSSLAYLSTLKVKATCSSETSLGCQRTSWHYIPEDITTVVRTSIPVLHHQLPLYNGNAMLFLTSHIT